MEKLVAFCQQLQMGAKTPVHGKAATFQKVPILHLCVSFFVRCCVHVYTEMNEWLVFALSLFLSGDIKLVTSHRTDFVLVFFLLLN